jgi:hypothetical protein
MAVYNTAHNTHLKRITDALDKEAEKAQELQELLNSSSESR